MPEYRLTCDECLKPVESVILTKGGKGVCDWCFSSSKALANIDSKKKDKVKVDGEVTEATELDVTFEQYVELGSRKRWYAIRRITSVDVIKKVIEYEKDHCQVYYKTAITRLKKLSR